MKRKMIYLTILLITLFVTPCTYASFYYEIGEQHELLTVQTNGTIRLEKDFTFHVTSQSTELGTEVWVGLPTNDTSVVSATFTLNGKKTFPHYRVKEDDEIYVIFTDFPAIRPGETGHFSFRAQIPDLVYWLNKDQLKKAPQNQQVSISYIPAWWEKGTIDRLTVEMQFEQSLEMDRVQVTTTPSQIKDMGKGSRLIWEYTNLRPNEKVHHAVILPRQYFAASVTPGRHWMPLWALILIITFVGLGLGGLIIGINYSIKNRRYASPIAYMKGDKAYTHFDPVEVALFYNLSTDFIAKLIIMGLIKKNVIQLHGNDQMKRVPTLEPLTWYEEHFLKSVDEHIQIIPDQWREEFKEMVGEFYDQIEGYCGRQTLSHYNQYFKNNTFTEKDDPRWAIIQQQLAQGTFDQPEEEELKTAMPAYLHVYFPLFYLTVINPSLQKENRAHYSHVFPGAAGTGGGGNSGPGCACACACACASSGGCT